MHTGLVSFDHWIYPFVLSHTVIQKPDTEMRYCIITDIRRAYRYIEWKQDRGESRIAHVLCGVSHVLGSAGLITAAGWQILNRHRFETFRQQ